MTSDRERVGGGHDRTFAIGFEHTGALCLGVTRYGAGRTEVWSEVPLSQ